MMDEWIEFLSQDCARFGSGPFPDALGFGATGSAPNPGVAAGFVAPLTGMGILTASGADAPSFLHAQLSNDVLHLGPDEARLAGYCSPKGRLLATLLLWRDGEAVSALLPGEILPALQRRLQMFVLRAKAKLEDASARHVLLGLGGARSGDVLAHWFPALPARPWARVSGAHGSLLRVPDGFGAPRYLWAAEPAAAQAAWPTLRAALQPCGAEVWRLAEIEAGLPQVGLATQDRFVPQMVNYELLGGVNFKKGCYPGQEIVARTQYLGKQKRRMLLAALPPLSSPSLLSSPSSPSSLPTPSSPGVPAAGMEVFSSLDPGQPCGMVVNAAPDLAGGWKCLAEIKTAAAEGGQVTLGSPDGPALRFLPPPYPLAPLEV